MKALGAVLLILVGLALIVVGPLLTIWALNTLFPVLNIKSNIETWFAVLIVGAFLRANVKVRKE